MRILVTGANGFVGRNLVPLLRRRGHDVLDPDSVDLDLTDAESLDEFLESESPEAVIHLAALCGGIQFNRANPARLWYVNTVMGANVLELCAHHQIGRLVLLATTCGYPKSPKAIPFVEEELWDGLPEPTNAPYGIAKRSLAYAASAYRAQYGLDTRVLVPTNLYGPGDHFLEPDKSHVIPGLIQRIWEASKLPNPHLEIWGTGNATRDFLYVGDACEAITLAVEKDSWPKDSGPINLGSGSEVSIAQLVTMILSVMDCQVSISWDSSKPDGQPRRCMDTSKARKVLGWSASTPLPKGLVKTFESFKKEVYRA